jgi:hypothetical protein
MSYGSQSSASSVASFSGSARAQARSQPESGGSATTMVSRRTGRAGKSNWARGPKADANKAPDPILFQTYFKSVGPRTYAAQLKRAGNGNHYLVFTEGKRDKVTDEVRKTSLFVFSEDFVSFFKLLKETAEFVRAHPVPAEVAQKRTRYWQKEKAKPASQKQPAHP